MIISLENQFLVFLRVAILHMIYCTSHPNILLCPYKGHKFFEFACLMFLDCECTDITSSKYDDINTITSVLKLYFRLLPIPFITILLFSMFLDGECTDITSSKYDDINTITSVLNFTSDFYLYLSSQYYCFLCF